MTVEDPILFDLTGGLARITLNRPEVSNAFDLPTARLFATIVERCSGDDIRVVLVSGAGQRFCAGGDVATFLAHPDPSDYMLQLATELEQALRGLGNLDKPVVAAVHGSVAGAGLALLLNADVVVAAPATRFVMAYSNVGLTPDCGVSFLLPRVVGLRRALELSLTDRVLTAAEALEWGLITAVEERPIDASEDWARRIEERAPIALGLTRQLMRSGVELDRDVHALAEARMIAEAVKRPEAERLIARFLRR